MNAVWKFPLRVDDAQEITVPEGSRWLDVQVQNGSPCLWALVDPEMPPVKVEVRITGTGHDRNDLAADEYVASFQIADGKLVFHVFAGEAR